MSIGHTGGVSSSAAGSPLQQRTGPEADRRAKETSDQNRQTDTNIKAEKAAGIGQTDEDSETSDRDANGQRLWEKEEQAQQSDPEQAEDQKRKSKAHDNEAGGNLDLTG